MARILVIDDDLDLLQMMRMLLQRGGHEPIVTGDGADGVAKAGQLRPDLIIVDVMMPGMNGYQVVRQLRENPDTAGQLILVLTARAQPVDRDTALAAQADDYIAKPVAPADLLKKINELLAQGTRPSAKLAMAVFSLRGGAGVTTLAANLGLAFQQAGRRVGVGDLSLRSGHMAMQFRLQAKVSWVDMLPQFNRHGLTVVEKVLLKHESGLYVLPGPLLPPLQAVDAEALARLLALLKSTFDTWIMDVSGGGDGVARTALNAADHVIALMTPEVASLQSAVAMVRWLGAVGVPDERVILAVNQVMPRPGLSIAAIEKALNRPAKWVIPYEESQIQALGQGAPLFRSNPEAGLSVAVKQALGLFSRRRA